MNKLTSSVVATFVCASSKKFNNALALALILYYKCSLFKNSYENISNLQMPISHARIVQSGQLRCFFFLYLYFL